MCVINEKLGQTHSPASSDRYFHLRFVLFCEILKSGDERTDGSTDTTCENSDHCWPLLWSRGSINILPAPQP